MTIYSLEWRREQQVAGNHEYKETVSLNCVQSSLNPVYRILPWQWFFSFHHLLHCTSSSSSRIYTNLLRCSVFSVWSRFSWIWIRIFLDLNSIFLDLNLGFPGSESWFFWILIQVFLEQNPVSSRSESRFSWIRI